MYPRITQKFYAEEWLIRADVHTSMGRALQAHLDGNGNLANEVVVTEKSRKDPPGVEVQDGHAFLSVAGIMGKHLSLMEVMCAGGYDIALLERQMLELRLNQDVHTVVMSIDSPGGTATGIAEVASLVREVAAEKRTIAYVDTQACSAAYWIAAACDEIYGGETSVVGSISAYLALVDESRAYEMAGLRLEYFRDGSMKGIGLPGKSMEATERMYLQERVNQIGGKFKAFVEARRPQATRAAMDGRWFSGEEAVQAGLMDGFYPSLTHLAADTLRI